MSGNGSQFCFVIPRYNVVMAKINDYRNAVQVNHQEFYPLIVKSVERGKASGPPDDE